MPLPEKLSSTRGIRARYLRHRPRSTVRTNRRAVMPLLPRMFPLRAKLITAASLPPSRRTLHMSCPMPMMSAEPPYPPAPLTAVTSADSPAVSGGAVGVPSVGSGRWDGVADAVGVPVPDPPPQPASSMIVPIAPVPIAVAMPRMSATQPDGNAARERGVMQLGFDCLVAFRQVEQDERPHGVAGVDVGQERSAAPAAGGRGAAAAAGTGGASCHGDDGGSGENG